MKKKQLISALITCLLLTGCASNKHTAPKVNYSGLFQPKASSGEAVQENKVNAGAAAYAEDNGNFSDEPFSDDTEAVSDVDTGNKSSSGDLTVGKTRTAKAAPGGNDQTADETADNGANEDNANSDNETAQSPDDTTSDTQANTPVKTVDNRDPKSVIYADAQTVAELSFGDICYFPYKTGDEDKQENNSEDETDDDTEDEETSKEEYVSKKMKYDYGYRVVFRTETDTYLLGTFPYDYCVWDDVNDVCLTIEGLIEADCQMVGIPSFEDLKYFIDCGIVIPGQYEMWTSTRVNPEGNNIYYRNKKGAIYSTKNKTQKCGVCAMIKVSTTQNDPELLSSSWSYYDEVKARLEAEEEQYKLAFSEE